jgi:hypothetical protein
MPSPSTTTHHQHKKQKPKIGGYASTLNKRGKLSLVFDPDARKEYLTGFSKRKKVCVCVCVCVYGGVGGFTDVREAAADVGGSFICVCV